MGIRRFFKRNNLKEIVILFGCAGVIIFISGYFYFSYINSNFTKMEDRSNFGNIFNGLNTVVSALAFLALIYTASLQRKELRLQRQELRATRNEFKKQSEEFEKQNNLSIKSSYYSNLFSLFELHWKVKNSIVISPNNLSFHFDGNPIVIHQHDIQSTVFLTIEKMFRICFSGYHRFTSLQDEHQRSAYLENVKDSDLLAHLEFAVDALNHPMYLIFYNYYQQTAFVYSYIEFSKEFNENWKNDIVMFETTMSREEKVCLLFLLVHNRNNPEEIEKFRNCSFKYTPPEIEVFSFGEKFLFGYNSKISRLLKDVFS